MSLLLFEHCLKALLLVSAVSAEDSLAWGDWYNPPRSVGPSVEYSTNPVYAVGTTIELNWTTVYTNYSIALWQQHPGGGWATLGPVIYQTFEPSNDLFNWSVSPLRFDLTVSNIFFLWLYPGASTQQGSDAPKDQPSISSHYFNITEAREAAISTSLASITTSASPSLSVLLSTTSVWVSIAGHSAPATPIADTPSGHRSVLSPGASAGAGVGTAFLGILAIAGGVLWQQRRKKRTLQPQNLPLVAGRSELPGPGAQNSVMSVEQGWPAEAAATQSPAELDDIAYSGRFTTRTRLPPMSPRELPA